MSHKENSNNNMKNDRVRQNAYLNVKSCLAPVYLKSCLSSTLKKRPLHAVMHLLFEAHLCMLNKNGFCSRPVRPQQAV